MRTADRAALIKRLQPYWKMEAGNVVLLPALMLFMSGGQLGWVAALCITPMMLLLFIGAVYWRGKVRQLQDRRHSIVPTLRGIAGAKRPALILTVIAVVVAISSWLIPSLTHGLAERLCATIAAALAALEYINYYHRQLQHFDHRADFRRLLAGNGFRASQMAQDLRCHGLS